jgi:photosystem II stability/assembly factor-like uncharacterized protein
MRNRIAVLFLSAAISAFWPDPAAAQWVPAGKPGGCHITALVVSGAKVFAGTSYHGVFVSADQGATWKATGPGLPPYSEIDDLTVGENAIFAVSRGRVFVSTTKGAIWRPAGTGSSRGFYFWHLAVCGRTVIAGTNKGLLLSEDNGENWRTARPGLPKDAWTECLLTRGLDLYAGTSEGVFLSTDRGATWKPIDQEKPLGVNCLDLVGADLYVGTPDGVFSTAGNGPAWKDISSGLPKNTPIIRLLARGRNLFAGMWDGFFLSSDGGTSWRLVDSKWAKTRVNALGASEKLIFVGTESGLYISGDEGRTWASAGSGLPYETLVYPLAAIGQNLFAGTEIGIMLSTDNGGSWRWINSDIRFNIFFACSLIASGSDLFAGEGGSVHVSHDNGATWDVANSSAIDYGFEGPVMESEGHLYGLNKFYAEISRSEDGGVSWASVGLPTQARCLCAGGPYLFAGTGGASGKGVDMAGAAQAVNSVFRSKDGGATWQRTGLRFSAAVNCLAAIGPNLFVGTDRGLYVCGDFGQCPAASKLELTEDVSVHHFQVVGKRLFVGTNKGVYLVGTTGGNKDWGALDTKFPKGIGANSFAVIGRYLFASTADDGVWRLPLSCLSRYPPAEKGIFPGKI